MKIALLTYSTRARGGVVHTLALAEALAAHGEDVHVWSLARGGDATFFRAVDPSVTLRLVPFETVEDETVGARILRSITTLAEAFDPRAYDVVHAQDCISANAVPDCVRTIHHLDTFTTPELITCHENAIVRPYAHVCVSAAVAAEVESGWGVRAEVIPNGVDSRRFEAAALDDVGRRRWADRLGTYLLAVGGIEPRKGIIDLVEAMASMPQPRPRLVIAGGETLFDYRDYRATVLARAAALDIELDVLGPVEHEALPTLVAQAAAFAFPSVKEGFGLSAVEALAAGVPVVARDLPVLREVLGAAVSYAGTPHALASALSVALIRCDPARVEVGRAVARSFDWATAARRHQGLYRRLAGH